MVSTRALVRGIVTRADVDGLPDKFPASAFFETMNGALQSSDADKKQAMDMGKGIYAFTLKNAAGETDSWHIDLKNEGKVGKGVGQKPDGMFSEPLSMQKVPN